MNVYDFDGTIYNGDSSIDFYCYCISLKPVCVLNIIPTTFSFILYKCRIKSKEYFKSTFFHFIKNFNNIDEIVNSFWDKNMFKIKKFYQAQKRTDDIIISASPEFLLSPVVHKLGCNLIATKVDKETGNLIGKNCHGEEKVNRLKLEKNITSIQCFYTDSLNDHPLKLIAERSFLVKKNKIENW